MRQRSPVVVALALATCGSGLLNIYSLVHPSISSRVALLQRVFPLEIIAASRLVTLLLGFALVIASLNIYKRKRRAFQAVLALSVLSLVFHLAKGVNYEEAFLSFVLLALLYWRRRDFTVRSGLPDVASAVTRVTLALGLGVAYGVAGFWLLDRREFGIDFTFRESVQQTLRQLGLLGSPALVPHTRHATWFLDSFPLVTAGVVLYTVVSFFRPVLYRLRTVQREREVATTIAQQHGRSSLDFFKLWPDKSLYFSPSKQTFLAYSVGGGFALVLGDPVGPEADIEPLVRDFADFCEGNDWRCAFYQTLPDYLPQYERCGFATLKLGDDAIVGLDRFTLDGKEKRSLREGIRRIERQGIQARRYDPPLSDAVLEELKRVSDDWLRIPGRRERQFTLGQFVPDYVRRCPVMAAIGPDGTVLAFVNVIRSYRMGETTIDLMRRRADSPNGVMDYLLIKLFQASREQGFERFSLGLAPMSGFTPGEQASAEERAIHGFFQHLTFIFSFTGLRAYKAKFATDWEPRYIVYRHALDLPRVALTLARVSEI
jgi:phosphatidylglycerol lysyltransferase